MPTPRAATLLRPLKHVADVVISNVDKKAVDGQIRVRLCNYVDVYNHDVITDDLPFMDATASVEQVARFELRPGDVLITKDSETPADIAAAALVRNDLTGVVCGYHLAVLRPRRAAIHGPFLHWAISSTLARSQLSARATGITRFGLRQSAIGEVIIPVPPPTAQRTIADYLDRETARIDLLTRKNQRLVGLLRGRWQAELDLAFRSARNVVRARHVILHVEQGWSPQAGNRLPEESEWGVLKVGCVNGMRFRSDEVKVLENGGADRAHLTVLNGDVLISRANTRELVGSACLVAGVRPRTLLCDKLYRITLSDSIDPRYFVYAVSSPRSRGTIELSATGASDSMLNIAQSRIKELELPLPALVDQLAIVRRLDSLASSMEATEQLLARKNGLLQERRQALITAAVTGQLDIPEAA